MLVLIAVVATWITPFTAYFLLLSVRVTRLRIKTRTAIGDRTHIWSDPSKANEANSASINQSGNATVVTQLDPTNADKLTLAVRAHANYAENIYLGASSLLVYVSSMEETLLLYMLRWDCCLLGGWRMCKYSVCFSLLFFVTIVSPLLWTAPANGTRC